MLVCGEAPTNSSQSQRGKEKILFHSINNLPVPSNFNPLTTSVRSNTGATSKFPQSPVTPEVNIGHKANRSNFPTHSLNHPTFAGMPTQSFIQPTFAVNQGKPVQMGVVNSNDYMGYPARPNMPYPQQQGPVPFTSTIFGGRMCPNPLGGKKPSVQVFPTYNNKNWYLTCLIVTISTITLIKTTRTSSPRSWRLSLPPPQLRGIREYARRCAASALFGTPSSAGPPNPHAFLWQSCPGCQREDCALLRYRFREGVCSKSSRPNEPGTERPLWSTWECRENQKFWCLQSKPARALSKCTWTGVRRGFTHGSSKWMADYWAGIFLDDLLLQILLHEAVERYLMVASNYYFVPEV